MFIQPYYQLQFSSNETLVSGRRYQIGREFDIFLGSSVADTFNIGIVNPTDDEQLIIAVMYQAALSLTHCVSIVVLLIIG